MVTMMGHFGFTRRRGWLMAAVALLPLPVSAQFSSAPPPAAPYPSTVQPIGPEDRLAANLLVLAQNPRDVIALTEAGKSALAIGDGNAALSFFAKAEELSPSDSRIKAGIGTALLLLEEPNEAMKLYAEAASLGLPDREFAKDRGLAFDLLGDSRRAQQDYALALKTRPDDETTRRLALSLGLSGDRDRGLKLLDPLLKKQDQAAWRARAFILAMNGNMRDAERIVDQVMPVGMGSTMTPFLRRLANLTPAQRARAVNFGTMPETGIRTAAVDTGFRPMDAGAGAALIPAEPQPVQVAAVDPKMAARLARAERRRPGQDRKAREEKPAQVAINTRAPPPPTPTKPNETRLDSRIDTRIGTRIGPVDYDKLPPEVRAAIKQPETVKTGAVKPGALPVPDSSVRPPVQVAVAPPPPPVLARVSAEPPPVFEIPAPKSAPPPVPVVSDTPKPIVASSPFRIDPVPTPPKPVFAAPPPAATRPVATVPSTLPGAAPVVAPAPVVTPAPAPVANSPAVVPLQPPVAQQPLPSVIVSTPPPAIRPVETPPSSVATAAPVVTPPPKPVELVATPAPAPVQVVTPAPSSPVQIVTPPPPPPVQVALASPLPSQAPSRMGPPAPDQPSSAFPPVTPTEELIPAAARPEPETPAPAGIVTEPPKPAAAGLAGLLADIQPEEESAAAPLPSAAELRAIRATAQKRAVAEAEAKAAKEKAVQEAKLAKDKATKEAADKAAAAKKNPARIWVQVATGANESGLSGTWKRIREKAPGVFKGHSASVVPFRSTNRVLVGPFKSQAEARAMLGAMSKAGMQGSSYASEAGQEVARIAGK